MIKQKQRYSEYAESPALNFSVLKELSISPMHALYKYKRESCDAKALRVGTAFHVLALEPGMFGEFVTVAARNTKAGKEEAAKAEMEGRDVITPGDHALVKDMVDGISYNEHAKYLISTATSVETSFYWEDETTGLKLKAREDLYIESLGIQADLKTSRNVRHRDFCWSAYQFGYVCQLAFYRRARKAHGDDVKDSLIIATSKEAPHVTEIFRAPPSMLDEADKQIDEWLQQWKTLTENDLFYNVIDLIDPREDDDRRYNTSDAKTGGNGGFGEVEFEELF